MGRRQRQEEPAFGSDSFLDVICNIVGILIILIVLTGIRTQHLPQSATSAAELAAARARIENERASRRATQQRQREDELAQRERLRQERLAEIDRVVAENAQRQQTFEQQLAAKTRAAAEHAHLLAQRQAEQQQHEELFAQRSQQVATETAQMQQCEQETADLTRAVAALQQELLGKQQQVQQTETQLQAIHAELREGEVAAQTLKQALAVTNATSQKTQETTANLHEQIEAIKRQLAELQNKPRVLKKWVHYATPVAQQVDRQEIHYRCLKDRVVDLRLETLLEWMGRDIRAKDLSRLTVYTGTAGPVGGFKLRYLVSRVPQSYAEQIQNPYSVRIQVNRWELVPTADNLGETQATAFQGQSAFLLSLADHPPADCVITLWVYPDSFPLAKSVQTYLHQRGYQVALRPLPLGTPIAGSPFGTASRTQ